MGVSIYRFLLISFFFLFRCVCTFRRKKESLNIMINKKGWGFLFRYRYAIGSSICNLFTTIGVNVLCKHV